MIYRFESIAIKLSFLRIKEVEKSMQKYLLPHRRGKSFNTYTCLLVTFILIYPLHVS